ncbi:hypothetical protein HFN63_35485 [Rhizobium leguminosarum]|uniref:hypothetical protein n=1 Tax=Rhizobium leguminosarum TaxID=384 RepID=UPI001C94096C|nr:hypothetical protein [Rhizobium leguminosarum]MBY5775266.1 hypothetical protein [Rhizobium leguminosarum]
MKPHLHRLKAISELFLFHFQQEEWSLKVDNSAPAEVPAGGSTGSGSIREAPWETRPWLRNPASESSEDLRNFRLQILDPSRSDPHQRQGAVALAGELESLHDDMRRVPLPEWRTRSDALQDHVETAQTEDRISGEVYRVALTDLGAQNRMVGRQQHETQYQAQRNELNNAILNQPTERDRVEAIAGLAANIEQLSLAQRAQLVAAIVNPPNQRDRVEASEEDRAEAITGLPAFRGTLQDLPPELRAAINQPSGRGSGF